MTSNEKYFIYLISCFLNSSAPTKTIDAWNEIYKLSEINNVTGVIANEIMQLPKEQAPKGRMRSYFNQCLGRTLQRYEETNKALKTIEGFLNENNIDYALVKGAVVREKYPSPALRTSGDIDVIVRGEQFEELLSALKASKYKLETENPNVLVIELGSIFVELHSDADVFGEYYDGRIFDIATKQGNKYILDEYDTLLYVVLHLVKHLKCRGAGIRMLMDMDVCIRGIDGFDEDEFIKMCCDAGIEKCAKMLLSLCRFWFSTPVKDYFEIEGRAELLDLLSNTFINGGVFGFEINDLGGHYVAQSSENNGVGIKAKLKAYLRWIFPSVSAVRGMYFYSSKHSALIPLAYIQRFFEGVFLRGFHSLKTARQIANADDRAVIEAQLLEELDIR